MLRKLNCKFGILLVKKDSKPSLKPTTKVLWESFLHTPATIEIPLKILKIG